MSNNYTHALVWKTIDLLAQKRNMSVSALARRAGLDPTLFNLSKRFHKNGNPRYPTLGTMLQVFLTHEITWNEWARVWDKAGDQ